MPKRKVLESDIEEPCVKHARKLGMLVVKQTHAGQRSHPDRGFYITGGHYLQIEFKAPGELPSALQMETINKLRGMGFDVQIIDNVESGIFLIINRFAGSLFTRSHDDFTRQRLEEARVYYERKQSEEATSPRKHYVRKRGRTGAAQDPGKANPTANRNQHKPTKRHGQSRRSF